MQECRPQMQGGGHAAPCNKPALPDDEPGILADTLDFVWFVLSHAACGDSMTETRLDEGSVLCRCLRCDESGIFGRVTRTDEQPAVDPTASRGITQKTLEVKGCTR